MSLFVTNTEEFNIISEAEISDILNHFNSDLIMDVVNQYLTMVKTQPYIAKPNIMNSLENEFKMLMNQFPEKQEDIKNTRQNTYSEIIRLLCSKYNLTFFENDNLDYYTAAMYIWDFLVSNFRLYLVNFISGFISREKAEIYKSLDLDRYKKSKDSSTIYGKKLYSDMHITIICANLPEVLNNISGVDITLDNILSFIYQPQQAAYINSIVRDNGSFFSDVYIKFILGYSMDCITDIRLDLQQKYSVPDDINENLI